MVAGQLFLMFHHPSLHSKVPGFSDTPPAPNRRKKKNIVCRLNFLGIDGHL